MAAATEPVVISDPSEIRSNVLAAAGQGRRVGFVPTMGALHAGHVSLVDAAAGDCDDVAVSIFVNPTQFAPHEDFTRYPRTPAADLALLAGRRVRWVFAPRADDIYPEGWCTRISVDGPARRFEGELRPGHFSGVATVVCRLFMAVPAATAYFGAKDWQQTLVVRRMVRDLGLPIGIVVCETVREPDGLAMSSRNAYLGPGDRSRALGLSVRSRSPPGRGMPGRIQPPWNGSCGGTSSRGESRSTMPLWWTRRRSRRSGLNPSRGPSSPAGSAPCG